ncbi:Flavohemoprotein [Andreprevotia sp. IGB-42]|uniref:2Fe-2S iron-sulfur cluster-binding protein n=1 Tax=Andreprevotia sp. IGB-42 TaxID=2497473 RepID=UPI0013583CAF|nr:pyridoxamine 5'-phosphate oxidase family protein [Andreprevotia sp. IGB-42]KAF0813148.1 Flavohemoprotein [Andreprevotia sp. IGB-42]
MAHPPGWAGQASPFHAGEQAVQQRVGVRDKVEAQGRQGIRDYLPEQHRQFYPQLPFIVLGALDAQQQPWATLLMGAPGFMQSPDPYTLQIDAQPVADDPLASALQPGAEVGLLGIELQTRRRNRMNGRLVSSDGEGGLRVAVAQSFGNCPQYIQQRDYSVVALPAVLPAPEHLAQLDEAAIAQISNADTFFIATAAMAPAGEAGTAPQYGADVSHRGGKPGFVRVDDTGTLTWPDFLGNFHFNTLGNLQLNPRAGLVFPDFATGDLLYLAGRGEVIWDGPALQAFAGAERLVRFHVTQVLRLRQRMPLRWALQQVSPVLTATGDWQSVRRALDVQPLADQFRPLQLVKREQESVQITSFYLQPADGLPLAPYQPGQFLPIRVDLPGTGALLRTYTLSQAADGNSYRISVKREGKVSTWLHDQLQVGSMLAAQAPRGAFVLDTQPSRPVVLISGGVGITPMLAMLDALAPVSGPHARPRAVWFIHAARNGREHAFGPQLRQRAAQHPGLQVHVRYSQPDAADQPGHDYHSSGRIDAALLRQLLPLDDYDIYLCGPDAFMRQVYWVLRSLGVARSRIRYEQFAQATPLEPDAAPPASVANPPAIAPTTPQTVHLQRSGQIIHWQPGSTLLETLEAHGHHPAHGCRAGLCGSCSMAITRGEVGYPQPPAQLPGAGRVLVCCAVPLGAVGLDF